MDEGLKQASLFVGGASLLFARWAKGFREHPNRLPQFDPEISNAAGGDDSIIYYHGYWKLEPDEVLVIEAIPRIAMHGISSLTTTGWNHWIIATTTSASISKVHITKRTG